MGDGSGVNSTLVATNEPQARKTDTERVQIQPCKLPINYGRERKTAETILWFESMQHWEEHVTNFTTATVNPSTPRPHTHTHNHKS